MPSFLLSPFVKWSLAALGGAMIVHWAVKEARRINEELEQARRVKAKITDADNRPTLRRDPTTGEYRLGRPALGLIEMAIGDPTVAADHGREEQHDQHPPDNLKLDHGGLPLRSRIRIVWVAAAPSTARKFAST